MVLANVPSFRFSFRGNIRRNHPFGNHPFVNTKKAQWEMKGRFRKRVVLANVPLFRFSFRGNIRQNHPFGNHSFVKPRICRENQTCTKAWLTFLCCLRTPFFRKPPFAVRSPTIFYRIPCMKSTVFSHQKIGGRR